MYIKLIRNQAQGNAITGRLVIDGRWYCNTLERVGYQIPALCYHVAVTQSPKFKRRLPIVQNVPRIANSGVPEQSVDCSGALSEASNSPSPIAYRTGIRIHRGTKPEHSTGCVLVPPEKECLLTYNILKAQNAHEEIILEVIDFTPGTEYGYNHPCPSSECACEKEIRSAHFARRHSSSILVLTKHSDDFKGNDVLRTSYCLCQLQKP